MFFFLLMSNGYFDFKQFRIRHDRCAMKVGTDAVLLGAWADLCAGKCILDVGCGSGILSLMAAQRAPQAEVFGIDIDAKAVGQAQENVMLSPFSDRVHLMVSDVRNYSSHLRFDNVLCNPPFYTEDVLPPDASRRVARNNRDLPFQELVKHVSRLLHAGFPDENRADAATGMTGQFHVVIPFAAEPQFTSLCIENSLYLSRICKVKTVERKEPKRCLCTYSTILCNDVDYEELVVMKNGERSEAFKRLTDDFYLDDRQSS